MPPAYKAPNTGNGSGLTNVNADKLKTLTMTATAPKDGQSIVWNANTNTMEWQDLNTANQNQLIEYYTSNKLPKYIGYSLPGTSASTAGWSIKLITYDAQSNVLSRKWAGGTNAYTKVWNSRDSYDYST